MFNTPWSPAPFESMGHDAGDKEPNDRHLSLLSATIHRKRFAIANSLILLVFVCGNILLPQLFFFPYNDAMFALGTFVSGVWGTQVSILGVYAALANQSLFVRLTWFSVGLVACVFSVLMGIEFASQGLFMRMDMTLAAILAGLALAYSSLVLAVGVGIRSTCNVRLDAEPNSQPFKNNSFNLAFLFRLTAAIALMMLAWTLSPIRFNADWQIGPIAEFAAICLMMMLLSIALLMAVLQVSLATANRRMGFWLIPFPLLVGTPVVVLLARIILPNSFHFWFQLAHYFAFLSGFVLSLFVVGTIWRRTGMRLVR